MGAIAKIRARSATLPTRLRALYAKMLLWQRRADGRLRLEEADDDLLRDIGVSREDAMAEARKPFWRP